MLYVHTVNCKIVVEVIDACRNQLIYNREENLTVVDYVEMKSFTCPEWCTESQSLQLGLNSLNTPTQVAGPKASMIPTQL
jgi:hypothetical protein